MSSQRGEKQLVVTGLEEGNLDAEVAVKRWCEVRANLQFKFTKNELLTSGFVSHLASSVVSPARMGLSTYHGRRHL